MCKLLRRLEARVGIEPTHKGFADLSLTTWVPRPIQTNDGRAGSAGTARIPTLLCQGRSTGCGDWSGRRDLNPRPSPWQGDALPLSYSRVSTLRVYRDGLSAVNVGGGSRSGPAHQLRPNPHANHFSVAHVQNAVADGGGFLVVRNHQHCLLEFAVGEAQHLEHRFGVLGVEVAGGFVGQDDRRTGDQRAGDRDALLFAAGEFGRPVIEAALDAEQVGEMIQIGRIERFRRSAMS